VGQVVCFKMQHANQIAQDATY